MAALLFLIFLCDEHQPWPDCAWILDAADSNVPKANSTAHGADGCDALFVLLVCVLYILYCIWGILCVFFGSVRCYLYLYITVYFYCMYCILVFG